MPPPDPGSAKTGLVRVVTTLLCLASCAPAPPERTGRPRNLLLISIDTLRADHLGCYGYGRGTSPSIDQLAANGVVFERAYATSSWTLPTVASLLTSTYTSTHGCWNDDSGLAPSFETLAESLTAAGFHTGAIVNHVYLDARFGFSQGFAEYDQELVLATNNKSHEAVTSEAVSDKALSWLAARSEDGEARPWFLWVHYFDPHSRYTAHEGITERFERDNAWGPSYADMDLYDGEVVYTDRHVGRLLDGLAERGFDDDTLVVLVADHGEEFGEHGGTGHRQTLYRETVQVPLVMRVPGVAPGRVAPPVSTLDVLPTTLAVLGVEKRDEHQGRSLLPLMLGGEADRERPFLAELELNRRKINGLQRARWKVVHDERAGTFELYDVDADPSEQRDLAGQEARVLAELKPALRRELARARKLGEAYGDAATVELTPADRQRIEDLGYAGDDE